MVYGRPAIGSNPTPKVTGQNELKNESAEDQNRFTSDPVLKNEILEVKQRLFNRDDEITDNLVADLDEHSEEEERYRVQDRQKRRREREEQDLHET